MKFSLVFFALLITGCPPSPVNPQPDADAATVADAAPPQTLDATPVPPQDAAPPAPDATIAQVCANLVKLNCSEGCNGGACFDGGGATCVSLLTHLKATPQITDPKFDCVAKAADQAAVRVCGPAWKDACGAPATPKKGK